MNNKMIIKVLFELKNCLAKNNSYSHESVKIMLLLMSGSISDLKSWENRPLRTKTKETCKSRQAGCTSVVRQLEQKGKVLQRVEERAMLQSFSLLLSKL